MKPLHHRLQGITLNLFVIMLGLFFILGSEDNPVGRLNDTGITKCADNSATNLDCPISTHPNQDAQSGRDITHNDDSDGHAGFSFTKISSTGAELPASATSWSCVKDNVTGLIWEVKTTDGGLHDEDNTYTWYNPDTSTNGGSAGTENGSADTDSLVSDVNNAGYCGAYDWRLPNIDELSSIVDYSIAYPEPTIDTNYFPNATSTFVWSSSPSSYVDFVWMVGFTHGDGTDGDGTNLIPTNGDGIFANKSNNIQVRLVRSGQ